MQGLDFCQQCSVYHNIILVEGRPGFVQCEKRIYEDLPQQIDSVDQEVCPSNSSTPNSKLSYTSLQYHFTTPSKDSRFKPINSPDRDKKINVRQLSFQNSNTQRRVPTHNPQKTFNPQINIVSVKSPPLHPQKNVFSQPSAPSLLKPPPQSYPIRLRPGQPKGPFLMFQEPSFLSTIKEEKYDDSELSKSVYTSCRGSKRSSFEPRMSLEKDAVKGDLFEKLSSVRSTWNESVPHGPSYRFKKMRKRYQINGNSGSKQQKICWCW